MKLTSRSGRHSSKIELQMTSMIDCVFLLLIYFMTTTSFMKTERELDPAIKVERAGRQASDLAPAMVDVVAGHEGYVYKLGGREFTSADELTEVLRQFDNKLDVGAVVRVADDAPFAMAATAIQACKGAGFQLVSYVPLSSEN